MSERGIDFVRKIVVVLVLGLVLSVSSLSIKTVNAQAGQVTLKPTDDTYVDSNNPNSNYGEQYNLQVRWLEDYPLLAAFWPRSIVWLKFNLSSVPDGAIVDMATIQLHTSSVNDTHDVHAHSSSDSSWNESTLTYYNMSSVNNTSMDSVLVVMNSQWYNWSVLDAVKDGLSNTAKIVTVSLWEESPSNTFVWFDSKESPVYSMDYSPKLTVHWSTVVPEFPTFLILPLFMIATLLAVIVYTKKHEVFKESIEVFH